MVQAMRMRTRRFLGEHPVGVADHVRPAEAPDARAARLELENRRMEVALATVGHELRNALFALESASRLVDPPAHDGQRASRAQRIVQRQLRCMRRLTDDLLTASSLSLGQLTLEREPLDLVGLVADACEDLREAAAEAGIELTAELPEEPIPVLGDPVRLAQVLSNLLANAIKFTAAGGEIRVRLQPIWPARRAAISVRDTGVGIEPAALPYVFDGFYQAERGLGRGRQGLGLGLHLVQRLVELHGGRVAVDSAGRGHGAEFSLWLPLHQEQIGMGLERALDALQA